MTRALEAEGPIEGGKFSFGETLLSGQTLVTDQFAVKFIRHSRDGHWPRHNFKLYVIHPSSTDVFFTREGMVFPANEAGELEGFKISRVRGLNQVGRIYIGEADFDFKKLFPGDEGQNLDFTLTSPDFIGHVVDERDISLYAIREAYIQRAQSGV